AGNHRIEVCADITNAVAESNESNCSTYDFVVASVAAATISLSPASFFFSGVSGGATPAGKTLTISNTGSATLNWTGATNQTWCHISSASGSVAASGSQNVTVSVNAPSNVGTFNCTVTITDSSASNSPQTAAVTYTVTSALVESCTGMSGYVQRDYWSGIGGVTISDLTSNANYPNNPTSSSQPASFEAPTNIADNYGTRMYGLIKAPATGSYRFYIASDDYSDLYLSTDANPANKVKIATVAGWTNSREWTKYAGQTSALINLTAGQTYYIEAIHKEGTGGDNLAVGWRVPNSSTTNVVPGSCLGPYIPAPAAPGGSPSPNPGGYNSNSSNPPGGGSVACEYLRLAWTDNSNNETGFKIYKDSVYLTTVPASSPASATGGTLTYEFNPGDLNAHSYAIAATGASGDSAQVPLQNNPVSTIACVANLTTSDKDIVAINGTNIGTGKGDQCSGTDALPVGTQLDLGDKVKFSINLCNSGTEEATGITVTDHLTNLVMPTAGWNAKYDSGSGEVSIASVGITLSVSGTAPNQILTFTNVPNVPTPGPIPPAIRRITFEAQLSIPANFSATSARFQNSFSATYNAGTVNKNTPLILFFTGQEVPIIIEVP
ncbi:MAG: PA14 domain-containing protein, partial [Patescibacteria group bacterium]